MAQKLFLCALVAFFSVFITQYGQAQPAQAKIVVTDPDAIKDIKAFVELGKKIVQEKKSCKSDKDFKQECVCNKSDEYKNLLMLLDSAMGKHLDWHTAILEYEIEKKRAKTSLSFFYNKVLPMLDKNCRRQADGSYVSNYAWDKPELKIKNPDLINKLNYAHKAEKEISMTVEEINTTPCTTEQQYTKCLCKPSRKEKYEQLLEYLENLTQEHPELYKNVVLYIDDGYVYRTSLQDNIEKIKVKLSYCK